MRFSSILGRGAGLLLLAMVAAAPAPAQTGAQTACSITLGMGEEGKVTVKKGDQVSVCLPLNSGTGYSWKVQMGGDDFSLQPKATFERNGTQPGAPGFTRFTMQPQMPGDYTLIFMLVPPGQTGVEAGRSFFGLKVI
jgi:predicted secreted protein